MSEQPIRDVLENLGIYLQSLDEVVTDPKRKVEPGEDHHRVDFIVRGELGKLAPSEVIHELGEVAMAKWSDNPAVRDMYNKLLVTIRMTDG